LFTVTHSTDQYSATLVRWQYCNKYRSMLTNTGSPVLCCV